MTDLQVNKLNLIKLITIAILGVTFLVILRGMTITDGCALVGLIYLVIGSFRLINKMRFFESTKYGYKKLIQIIKNKDGKGSNPIGSYVDYIKYSKYEKSFVDLLIVSFVLIILSIFSINI